MLRISEDTRVEDCATPSSLSLLPVSLMDRQIGAVRHDFDQFVEQVHHLRTRTLQLLDDLHARNELLLLRLEIVDLLNLLVQQFDLTLEALVALFLAVDHDAQHHVHGAGNQR
jgi:hypothetical protein